MKNYNTKENFKWIAKKLVLEVHYTEWGKVKKYLFGLKWGEGKTGRDLFGISRKVQIGGLNWADKNPAAALKILNNL